MSDETDTTTQTTQTETPPEPEQATPAPEKPETPAADDQLGDGGQKALRAERERRKAAERAAAEAAEKASALEAAELRRSVAADKALTPEQAAFLTGEDREAMEASADALQAAFKPDPRIRRSPTETLRSGATGATEPADPGALADDLMRSW